MNENKRPARVTAIGVFVLVIGILSLVSILPALIMPGYAAGMSQGFSMTGQTLTTAIVFNLLLIVSGFGLLKGFSWGRILLLVAWPLRVAALIFSGIGTFLFPAIVGGAIGYVIFIVILTAPDSSSFFRKS